MRRVFLLLFVVSMSSAAFLQAQPTPALRKMTNVPSIVPQDYGVQDYTYTEIPASEFRPVDSATGYHIGVFNGSLTRTGGGGGTFVHGLSLPSGAYLSDITVYVSDTSAAGDVILNVGTNYRNEGDGSNLYVGLYPNVNTTGQPGDTALVIPWGNTLPTVGDFNGDTIPDEANWLLYVSLATTDGTTGFNLVRLKWKRQVSPAPASARFTDVPTTHVFFQYIEALAASGITSGCTASQYCPDAPLTRGQMAVFLARALGLHWTP